MRKLLGDSEASVLLFSSTSALFGSPGQGNYAAANAVLDSMAHKLCFEGHRARTIQWGPWAEAGMAVETNAVARLKAYIVILSFFRARVLNLPHNEMERDAQNATTLQLPKTKTARSRFVEFSVFVRIVRFRG